MKHSSSIPLKTIPPEQGFGMAQDYILERERLRLQELINDGLPPCYKDKWEDMLFDFYPDFSWNNHSTVELQWLLEDEKWNELAARLLAKRGFDFKTEIDEAVADRITKSED